MAPTDLNRYRVVVLGAHNFVVHVNRSELRRQLFKDKQKTSKDVGKHLYELVVDGGVR